MAQSTRISTKSSDRSASNAASDRDAWSLTDGWIQAHQSRLIEIRRRIHAAPEASGHELKTTALVAQTLQEAGLNPRVMRGGIGLIVDIDLGAPAQRFIAIRAELDCVHVGDDKTVAYASMQPGLCHACGHDAHTTIALATVLAIHAHRAHLAALNPHHNIRAIFQPAEETATGARSMIEQGALEDVRGLLAVHVEPFLAPGVIGLRKGPLTSACKSFEIHIIGRSGHSARPFQAIDPIPAATNLVSLFYQLAPHSMDSRYPLALTVASINAGTAFNAIPDEATIRGTLRAARVEDLAAVERKMNAVIEGVARSTDCGISITWPQDAPATNNDARLTDIMAQAATDLLGPSGVQWLDVPSLGAEDFAFFQQVVPGAIVRLGAGVPDPSQRKPLHSSLFDIDERCLAIGAQFMSRSAWMAAMTF